MTPLIHLIRVCLIHARDRAAVQRDTLAMSACNDAIDALNRHPEVAEERARLMAQMIGETAHLDQGSAPC